MIRTLTLAAVSLVLLGGQALAQDAPKGDATRGHQLWMKIGCFQCHGFEGVTGGPGGRLAPNVIPYEALMGQLRHPIARMPVYTAVVTPDQDVADIYAYLKSQPQPKPVSQVPLLNQ